MQAFLSPQGPQGNSKQQARLMQKEARQCSEVEKKIKSLELGDTVVPTTLETLRQNCIVVLRALKLRYEANSLHRAATHTGKNSAVGLPHKYDVLTGKEDSQT